MSAPDLFDGTPAAPRQVDEYGRRADVFRAENMTPRLWPIAALAVETGWSRSQLSRALADLPPDDMEGRTRLWRLRRVVDHLLHAERARWVDKAGPDGTALILDPDTERARKDRALAEKAELETSQRRGDLVRVADAAHYLGRAVRSQADALHGEVERIVIPVAAETSPVEVRAVLLELVDMARGVLADGIRSAVVELTAGKLTLPELDAEPEPETEPEAEPAAPKRKRGARKKRARSRAAA